MSTFDDFLDEVAKADSSDSQVTGDVGLDEIIYYGQRADWGWGRSKFLGLYKLIDDTVLLAAAQPGVSLADQDLEVLGQVTSAYQPEFLTDNWVAMAGWRKGTNGHDTAEGFRIVYSNGDRNGYGDRHWLQTFEFYGDEMHGASRAIADPTPLSTSALKKLEELHESGIDGDGLIGPKGLRSDQTPGTDPGLIPGTADASPSSGGQPDTSDVKGLLDQLGAVGGSGQQPININIVNNTNTGSGNISTGDINQGNIYNTFTIDSINLNLNRVIVEASRKADVVEGTSGSDTIAAGLGSDTLIGGKGEDFFVVGSVDEEIKKKTLDVIKDFKRNDQIVLDDVALPGLDEEIDLAVVESKKEFRAAGKDDAPIIYDQNKGKLFYDSNGDKKGMGGDGGQILKLNGKAELDEDNVSLLAENVDSVEDLIAAGEDSAPMDDSLADSADAVIVPANEV